MEMEQISAQLAAIANQLAQLGQKQTEHDQVLTYLNQKIEEPPKVPIEEIRENRQAIDLFRIPDPIKSIPHFDGNKKQVTAWLKTAEETLRIFEPIVTEQQFRIYIQAVKNKIEGKARDILCLAGDPESFLEMKTILLEALGDKQELSYYKSQLWANKQQENMSVHIFYNRTKEIVQNIKTLAKQNPTYNNSWQAICSFIEEDALAAFISGLKKPYFGFAQAAKPKNLEEAYAFLCKFNTNEIISNNSRKLPQNYSNVQKSNQFGPTQVKSNQFQQKKEFSTVNHKKTNYPTPETQTPMEVDPSFRSRNTRNKYINNHEVCGEKDPEIEIENNENFQENQELDSGNFQADQNSDTED